MSERFAVPKILIIHGCNTHDGCSSEQMREFLPDDCHVVCNTPTALEHWSLPRSRYILHGFSPEEWWQTSYELPNVLVVQPKHGRHPEVTNDRFVAQVETKVPITWLGRDVRCGCFDSYRRFLSKSSIFFNPSLASANPRARAEAMLSGLAIVTTASHGEEEYIINGENGFCSNDEDELLDFLLFLTAHPEEVERIGKNGREMARDLFHIDRFTAEWNTLLQTVVEGA
jgi:glycosyltransferase involved in cell wall biosynthesis